MGARKPVDIVLSLENAREVFQPGDIIAEAEELGQVVSARPDVRGEWIMVYFMGGDCHREQFGPQTLTVLREVGGPEYEWRGRPSGTHGMVEISKDGGGTLGRRYSGRWTARATQNGKAVYEGGGITSGTPTTHEEMARIVWAFVDESYDAEV